MGKTKVKNSKPGYLGQKTMDLSKTLMYKCHCDNMQPRYGNQLNLCYMDPTQAALCMRETKNFCQNIAIDVQIRFDLSECPKDDDRLLPIGKNKQVIDVMKDEFRGKFMAEVVALRKKKYVFRKIKNVER